MNKEKLNKCLIIFLFLQPVLDVITSLQIRNNLNFFSIGTLIRGFFLFIIFIYLFKKKENRKLLFIFLLYSFLAMMYTIFFTENHLLTEIFNIIKIFYLPLLILFFNQYSNKTIDDKLITILYFIYLNLIIIPYFLGIGFDIYAAADDKRGYIGLFYAGNEISAILLGLLPIVYNYIIQNKSKLLKVLFFLELFGVTVLLSTKTMFLGVILVLGLYLLRFIILKFKTWKKSSQILLCITIVFGMGIGVILIPKLPVYNNLQVTLNYHEIYTVKDALCIDSIDKIIFSMRLSFLKNVHENYRNQNALGMVFGLGEDTVTVLKDIEIDIFDIFYSIGILGFLVWITLLAPSLKKIKLNGYYRFSFVLFVLMSLFSGHVLIQPMVAIYVALLFLLNRVKNNENN